MVNSQQAIELRGVLAPHGVLRVALNHANFLLVTAPAPEGRGVAADLGREMAARLGVEAVFVGYEHAGLVADAAPLDAWDVAFIGADAARSEVIFSPAYVGIEATFLVRSTLPATRTTDVDRPGVRIAVADRSAYHLALQRIVQHATLVPAPGLPASETLFVTEQLEALAGLRPHLMAVAARNTDVRVLDDAFLTVQQAIGVPRARERAASWVAEFAREAVSSGLVARLVAQHGVQGLVLGDASERP